MSKSISSKGKRSKPDSNITAAQIGIFVAILAFVGTVVSATLNYLSARAPIELSIQATQTAEAKTLALISTSATPASTGVPVFVTSTSQSPAPTISLGIGSTQISKIDGMTMLYVPAGPFTMGSDSGTSDEKPVHTVTLDAFWIDKTEVTNAMYALCVKVGMCSAPRETKSSKRDNYYGNSQFDNYPVIYVSWESANIYCSWVGRRLPTEAEWEKAARGTDGRISPWGNAKPDKSKLNYQSNVGDTTEVGKYPVGASIYGALDMAGNVWEWVNDWYDENYYSKSPSQNPQGPVSGSSRVLRGSSWGYYDYSERASYRNWFKSSDTYNNVGFRCAASP